MLSSPGVMDAVELSRKLQEEATCSICLDYFTNPVMTTCGHNFCRECIRLTWEKAKGKKGRRKHRSVFPCPECRELSPQKNLRPNRLLNKVAEMARQHPGFQSQNLCQVHQEMLKFFCEDDQSPICVVCRESQEHRPHRVVPVEEAVQEHKLKLEGDMRHLREEMVKTQTLQIREQQTLAEWQEKVKKQRWRIMMEFKKMAVLLVEEEQHLLQALRQEEEDIAARLLERMAALEQQSCSLETLLLRLEDCSKREPLQMLQDIKEPLDRKNSVSVQYPEATPITLRTICRVPGQIEVLKSFQAIPRRCPNGPQLISLVLPTSTARVQPMQRPGSQLDSAKGKPEVRENGDDSALSLLLGLSAENVVPDPATAYPYLLLYESRQRRYLSTPPDGTPCSKDRFLAYPCAVGHQTFSSGRHYWEVGMNLTGDALWALGVCRDNVSRKDRVLKSPENGFWVVQLCKGKKYVPPVSTSIPTTLTEPPSHVGIFLDFEAGEVSFYNASGGSHLHTYAQPAFPGPLQPFFCLGAPKSGQMVISTVTLWVKG